MFDGDHKTLMVWGIIILVVLVPIPLSNLYFEYKTKQAIIEKMSNITPEQARQIIDIKAKELEPKKDKNDN